MNLKVVSVNVGRTLLVDAFFMLLCMVLSVLNGMDSAFGPLLISFVITFITGAFPFIFVKRKASEITLKDGYLIIVLSWLLSFIFGMLPYVLWGGEFTLANAWFESVSGFTTTGATILTDIEGLPKSLLLWRSSTHFIGGLGVIMLLLLILPETSPFRFKLSSLEMSSLSKEGYRWRSSKKMYVIVSVYLVLTGLAALGFHLAGMSVFDSVNHAFSACATGGFSTRNESIASFDSVPVDIVCIIFMMLGSTHFGILFSCFATRSLRPLKHPVVKYFYLVTLVFALITSADLLIHGVYDSFPEALLHGTFQITSYISSTGFGSADNAMWPSLASAVMLVAAFQCGCSGSTTGGLKADRMIIAFKAAVNQIKNALYPNSVSRVKVGNTVIEDKAIQPVLIYIILYCFTMLVSLFLLMLCGMNGLDAFSSSLTSVANVGPAIGNLGTMGNFSEISSMAKVILSVDMIMGRVEIYPVLVTLAIIIRRK
ncbi:MAG: TrkH family potassium uptake protein [Bacteroidales bacterium]|nr:TrkH family potassium uptake protein [Bacteroidales bacterium]